ncbi:MAG TPA: hypothetical protein VHV10_06355 [Ktedonobacteraceae bacterium]|nr:hypothetical protein [Ktedonobacteraceae bacterium]
MPQQPRKAGSITALSGSIFALVAFFAFPFIASGPLSSTAFQLASTSTNMYGSTSQSLVVLWVAAILAVILCLLAIWALFSKGVMVNQPSGSIPRMRLSGGAKAASIGIIICSAIALILVLILYVGLSSSTSTQTSDATLLSVGYWIYTISIIAGLIGGIMQVSA